MIDRLKKNSKLIDFLVMFILAGMVVLFLCRDSMCPFSVRKIGLLGIDVVDSNVYRTIALQMKNGLMPYKDSFDHKGPLLYLVNYLGICISYEHGIWLLEVISMTAALYFMYKTANTIIHNKYLSVLAVVFSFNNLFLYFNENMVEEYAMCFISIAFYIFVDYFINEKIDHFRLIVCGFCFCAVFLLRQNMIALWIACCLGVLFKNIIDHSFNKVIEFILWFVIGALFLAVPIVLWLIINNTFNDFVFDYFLFNFIYSGSEPINKQIESFMMFFITAPMLISVFSALIDLKNRKFVNIIYLFTCLVSLVLISVSGMMFAHYGMINIPLFSYGYALFLSMLEKAYLNRNYELAIVLSLLVGMMIGAICIPNWVNALTQMPNAIGREIDVSFDDNLIVDLINKNTEEDDLIISYGNTNHYYVETKRLPASKYSYQFPIGTIYPAIFDEFISDLEKNQPKMVIIVKNEIIDPLQSFLDRNGYKQLWANDDGDRIVFIK